MSGVSEWMVTGAAAVDAVKTAISLARRANLAELEKVLLDLRDDIADLRDENLDLRNQNRELRQRLGARTELIFDKNLYWRKADDGQHEGPFCPKCFAGSDRVSPLANHPGDHYYRCPVCSYCSPQSAAPIDPNSHFRR